MMNMMIIAQSQHVHIHLDAQCQHLWTLKASISHHTPSNVINYTREHNIGEHSMGKHI